MFEGLKMTNMNKERKDFIEAMKKNGCPMWMFERDEDGNFEDMGMAYAWYAWQEKVKAQTVPQWINVEVGVPVKFGTRVKIKRKSWDEEDNLIFVESEATYDKDSDFCELSNRTHEYETWFDHELKKYLEEDEITHWAPLDKTGNSGAQQ